MYEKKNKETEFVFQVLKGNEVIGNFKSLEYANDFIDYQATISDVKFVVEAVPSENGESEKQRKLNNWANAALLIWVFFLIIIIVRTVLRILS